MYNKYSIKCIIKNILYFMKQHTTDVYTFLSLSRSRIQIYIFFICNGWRPYQWIGFTFSIPQSSESFSFICLYWIYKCDLNISLQSSPNTKKNLCYLDILTTTIVIACGIYIKEGKYKINFRFQPLIKFYILLDRICHSPTWDQ